jgi:hypothetical protein
MKGKIMFPTIISLSHSLTLENLIDRLKTSPHVAGLALFGSPPAENPASDTDLLVVLANPPVQMFQMSTFIGGRGADIAFSESETVERLLSLDQPVSATSPEGFLMSWLEHAQILVDDGKLALVQAKARLQNWRLPLTEADAYAEWFWLNFDLRHIKRLAESKDAIHLMVADMRLMGCVSQICRSYCRLRNIPWRGEKSALRHLQTHDSDFFDLLHNFLRESDRGGRLALCDQLVARALDGKIWPQAATSVWMSDRQPGRVGEALAFWEKLVSGGYNQAI